MAGFLSPYLKLYDEGLPVKPVYLLLPVIILILAASALHVQTGSVQVPDQGARSAPSFLPSLPVISSHQGDPDDTARKIARSADFSNPVVTKFVETHTAPAGGMNTISQVCDLWDAITSHWRYVPDPPEGNQYQPASESVSDGLAGNCLDYAILNAAVISTLGGESRVITAYDAGGNGHAYPEVYLGNSADEIQTIGAYLNSRYNTTAIFWHTTVGPDGRNYYWLNLDWQARYPGGPLFVDNGTYYAHSVSGTSEKYTDSGYPAGTP